jgi:hypothetical protein
MVGQLYYEPRGLTPRSHQYEQLRRYLISSNQTIIKLHLLQAHHPVLVIHSCLYCAEQVVESSLVRQSILKSFICGTMSRKLTGTREASHAFSWYDGRPAVLGSQLDEYLGDVPDTIDGKQLPVTGARVIIAP